MPQTKRKSISTTQTQTKSISMPILTPSQLRPASKNRVNFDHHHRHKNKSVYNYSQNNYFDPYTVNYDPPHKI